MIEHNDQNNQLPKELKSVFRELEIVKLALRRSLALQLPICFSLFFV